MLIEEELKQAEMEAVKANQRLEAVRKKNMSLSMMLCASQQIKNGEKLEYDVMLLRHYLFEEKLFTPEEFALYDKSGAPVITPEYLLEVEKNEHDRLAQDLMETIGNIEGNIDPDKTLAELKEHNSKGNGKISEEAIKELDECVLRHKMKIAQEELMRIMNDSRIWPSERQHKIVELMKFMDGNSIPYEEFKVSKSKLFEIGYQGI